MLYKIENGKIIKLNKVSFKSENEVKKIVTMLEEKREIFGENLLVIGKEVEIKQIQDKIDILAIDKQGKLVIIETKKSFYSGTNSDFQGSKYAGYVSKWNLLDIKNETEKYYKEKYNKNINFENLVGNFIDVDLSRVNYGQRILLIGSKDNIKLNNAVEWLSNKQKVDIKIIKLTKYKSNNDVIFIDAKKTIPTSRILKHGPILSFYDKEFHFKDSSRDVLELGKVFNEKVIEVHPNIEGPFFHNKISIYFTLNQKSVIRYRTNKKNIYIMQFSPKINKKKILKKVQEELDFNIDEKITF